MLRQRLVRAVLALCLGLLCSLAAEGCIAVVPYTPDDTVVDKLGPAEARALSCGTPLASRGGHPPGSHPHLVTMAI